MSLQMITSPARRPTHRRLRIAGLLALIAILIAAGTSTAVVVAGQSKALATATGERDGARNALDKTVRLAGTDGVEPTALSSLVERERSILAEPARRAFLIFDGGETAHLKDESGRLQALANDVHATELTALAATRAGAGQTLDEMKATVGVAGAAGLDTASWATTESTARQAVDAAATPVAVLAAVADLPGQIDVVRGATAKKLSADADYHAALGQAKSDAQSAVARVQQLLTRGQQTPQYQLAATAQDVNGLTAGLTTATTPEQFANIIQQANKIARGLRALFSAHDNAVADLQAAQNDFHNAQAAGKNTRDVGPQLDQEAKDLAAASSISDFNAVDNAVFNTITPLRTTADVVGLPNGKVISIDLGQQTLTAFENNVPVLSTLVTTGRPQLPTPPGQTSVMSKSHPFEMISTWPRSSPFYYPPSWVQHVLWFRDGGYGIHDAPWRSTYGPGTNGNNGTHGCVNVPGDVMNRLYDWADIGTPVIVH